MLADLPCYVTNALLSNLSKGTGNGTLFAAIHGNYADLLVG